MPHGQPQYGWHRYADEFTLLTPTSSGLKVVIQICEQYGHDYCVKFNGANSMYFVFRGRCKLDNRTVVLVAPGWRVFRMLYIWATVYPLLIRIA